MSLAQALAHPGYPALYLARKYRQARKAMLIRSASAVLRHTKKPSDYTTLSAKTKEELVQIVVVSDINAMNNPGFNRIVSKRLPLFV